MILFEAYKFFLRLIIQLPPEYILTKSSWKFYEIGLEVRFNVGTGAN